MIDTVYGPHDTMDWLRCPVYRALRKQWAPLADWTPNMLLGSAIDEGLQAFYCTAKAGGSLNDADDAAYQACERMLTDGYIEQPAWTLDALRKMAARGLKAALGPAHSIVATEFILAVDEPMGECRPDLVTRHKSTGELIVTDGKVTLRLDGRYQDQRIREYDSDFQFWHNAWATGLTYGETPAWTRLHLTALTPTVRSLLHPIRVTPERLRFWQQGAEWAWSHMATETSPAPNFTSCHGRYGRCVFYEKCHNNGDALYTELQR